jgi:Na+/proline symporter
VFILGIFFKHANARGAWAGIAASAIVLFLVQRLTETHVYLYALVGITVCVGFGYIASLFGRASAPGVSVAASTDQTRRPAAVENAS